MNNSNGRPGNSDLGILPWKNKNARINNFEEYIIKTEEYTMQSNDNINFPNFIQFQLVLVMKTKI